MSSCVSVLKRWERLTIFPADKVIDLLKNWETRLPDHKSWATPIDDFWFADQDNRHWQSREGHLNISTRVRTFDSRPQQIIPSKQERTAQSSSTFVVIKPDKSGARANGPVSLSLPSNSRVFLIHTFFLVGKREKSSKSRRTPRAGCCGSLPVNPFFSPLIIIYWSILLFKDRDVIVNKHPCTM